MNSNTAPTFEWLRYRAPGIGWWRILISALSMLGIGMAAAAESSSAASAHRTEVELGRALFEDKNLSRDRSVACSSCHRPDHAFSDAKPVSPGVNGRRGTRNAPSLLSVGAYESYFWDGRAPTLEAQVSGPLLNPTEMGLASDRELLDRVREAPLYRASFMSLGGLSPQDIQPADVRRAIVAYERSLARASPVDRYLAGDETAIPSTAREGLRLFQGKAGCSGCHRIETHGAPLTDNAFHSSSVGLGGLGSKLAAVVTRLAKSSLNTRIAYIESDAECAAVGRFAITLNPKDIGAFRTPSLRAVARSAPYMHDGSVANLEQAVEMEIYYQGEDRGYPVILSNDERRQLMAFIREL